MRIFFISQVVYPSDFPRRSRVYDHPSYKSNEWRNLSMFTFHLLVSCMGREKTHEKSVILSFAFLSRAMRLPTEEYQNIPENMIDRASQILSEHHELAFGQTAGSYNYHIVGSHLKFIRNQIGSFTEHNAYVYESSYGDICRTFMPGTRKLFNLIFTHYSLSLQFSFFQQIFPNRSWKRLL